MLNSIFVGKRGCKVAFILEMIYFHAIATIKVLTMTPTCSDSCSKARRDCQANR
jgi:hypothetical protein